MEAITNILKRTTPGEAHSAMIREQINQSQANLRTFKSMVPMTYETFMSLIKAHSTDIMLQRSVSQPYVVDRNNEPIIRQLYLYFTNDAECAWNLNSGLIFAGKIGCGKSLLMLAYLRVSNEFSRRITTFLHSKELSRLIIQRGLEYYAKRPLFIDEMGREESEVKDYGNVVKPVIDLFALRYENGARTYATTNFKYDSIEKFYGEFIRTRMEEMMTYVPFPGESRRLKNEIKTK